MKKLLIVLTAGLILAALYFIELSKIEITSVDDNLTLDRLVYNKGGELWDLFYKVRVTVVDGQRALFDIPDELKNLDGALISIEGAAAFRGDGSRNIDSNHVGIVFFDLVPLLSMTYGCEIQPDIWMRWTLVVNLNDEWILSREEMIDAEVKVLGKFRIDTSQPYNAAFFIDDAQAELLE